MGSVGSRGALCSRRRRAAPGQGHAHDLHVQLSQEREGLLGGWNVAASSNRPRASRFDAAAPEPERPSGKANRSRGDGAASSDPTADDA